MTATAKITMIAACSDNNIIGQGSQIPWHSKVDFKYFKDNTLGSPIIMGRKTFESIGRVLPGRLNIVVSSNRQFGFEYPELINCGSLETAIGYARAESNSERIFICGGGQIYTEGLKYADKILLTRIELEVLNTPNSVYFPNIDPKQWELKSVLKSYDEEAELILNFETWLKKPFEPTL